MRLGHGFEKGGCDRGLHSSRQQLRHRGATHPWHGKGGDSHARPRAEGGLYQRGGGEGKGERGGGVKAGEGRGQRRCKTYISI